MNRLALRNIYKRLPSATRSATSPLHLHHVSRSLSTIPPNVRSINRLLVSGSLFVAVGAGLWAFSPPLVHADGLAVHPGLVKPKGPTNERTPSDQSFGSLVRSYIVFSMCSMPILVDYSPSILKFLSSVPGVRQVTEALVRVTFFDQFVGGDTAHETVPLLHALREANKGALFAYSVEVDESEALASHSAASGRAKVTPPHKRIVQEMIRCIDVAADFEDEKVGKDAAGGRRTWVAVKMTALLPDANALVKLSSHLVATRPQSAIPFPGRPCSDDLTMLCTPQHLTKNATNNTNTLTTEDIDVLRDLQHDLVRICTRAQERGVKIIMDAEYSWYQPALDAYTLYLMERFNKLPPKDSLGNTEAKVQPLIYGTWQAYLRRTPGHLADSIQHAAQNNYALGVKLVRGAYHPHEVAAFENSSSPIYTALRDRSPAALGVGGMDKPPVWQTKAETDACYDACVDVLVNAVAEDIVRSARSIDSGLRHHLTNWGPRWAQEWATSAGRKVGKMDGTTTLSSRCSPRVGVLFGTHNWKSCERVLDKLVQNGVARYESDVDGLDGAKVARIGEEVTERIAIGQLFGMSDDLTNHLVSRTRSSAPFVIKYVPYGALSEVMPYLSRRAVENKSLLSGDGGAGKERRLAGQEILRRITESVGLAGWR